MRRRLLLDKARPYLNVTPTEVQWIDVDDSKLYNVESNTEWTIT